MWLLTVGWRERRLLPMTDSSSGLSDQSAARQAQMSQQPTQSRTLAANQGPDRIPAATVQGSAVDLTEDGRPQPTGLAPPLEHDVAQ